MTHWSGERERINRLRWSFDPARCWLRGTLREPPYSHKSQEVREAVSLPPAATFVVAAGSMRHPMSLLPWLTTAFAAANLVIVRCRVSRTLWPPSGVSIISRASSPSDRLTDARGEIRKSARTKISCSLGKCHGYCHNLTITGDR